MMRYDFPMIIPAVFVRMKIIVWKMIDLVRTRWYLFVWGIIVGRGCRFCGVAMIRTRRRGTIVLGNNVVFLSRSEINPVGLLNETIIDTRNGGQIMIGDGSGFSSVVISSRTSIVVGRNVKCGGNVRIFDHDFHSLEAQYRSSHEDSRHVRVAPIIIEDDCFIGTNVIILKGTHLGPRTIVAAGSVVMGLETPADAMVKGNPAIVTGRRRV